MKPLIFKEWNFGKEVRMKKNTSNNNIVKRGQSLWYLMIRFVRTLEICVLIHCMSLTVCQFQIWNEKFSPFNRIFHAHVPGVLCYWVCRIIIMVCHSYSLDLFRFLLQIFLWSFIYRVIVENCQKLLWDYYNILISSF